MNNTQTQAPRKVKKSTKEIIPEIKLQEHHSKKIYHRNVFWPWATTRMGFVIVLIIGAFLLGIRIGFWDFESRIWEEDNQDSIKAMIMNCRLIPAMPWCEMYNTWEAVGFNYDVSETRLRDMGKLMGNRTKNELDKRWLEAMIAHREWVIRMAESLVSAQHAELRDMWEWLINAQKREIEKMKKWQAEWGYIIYSSGSTPENKIAL